MKLNTNIKKSNLKKVFNKTKSNISRKKNISSCNGNYNPSSKENIINLNKKYFLNIKNHIVLKLNYNEINDLPFEEALNKDKRNYIQYYMSLLKTKHSMLYICYTKDYNSKIVKVSIQIFDLATLISVNSLFFNDDTMHKIYVDHGSFNFIYQLPQIIYSSIISSVLNIIN